MSLAAAVRPVLAGGGHGGLGGRALLEPEEAVVVEGVADVTAAPAARRGRRCGRRRRMGRRRRRCGLHLRLATDGLPVALAAVVTL